MTKQEFLEKLAALLQDIPAEEREAALEFYRGYFDDAGEGREAEVIRELESPEKVAEQIKNGLKTGLGTDSYENAGSPYDKNTSSRPVPENYGSYEKQPRKSSGWRTFGIVCLVLFIGIPIGIPVLVTVFGPGPVGPGLCGTSGCGCGYGDGGGLFCRNRISGCGCCEACSGTRRGSDALRQRLYLPGSRNFAVASPHVGDRKRRSGLLAGDQMALQKDFL